MRANKTRDNYHLGEGKGEARLEMSLGDWRKCVMVGMA